MKLLMVNLQVHEELLGLHHCSSVDVANLSIMINDLISTLVGCVASDIRQVPGVAVKAVLLSESLTLSQGSFVHCYIL